LLLDDRYSESIALHYFRLDRGGQGPEPDSAAGPVFASTIERSRWGSIKAPLRAAAHAGHPVLAANPARRAGRCELTLP